MNRSLRTSPMFRKLKEIQTLLNGITDGPSHRLVGYCKEYSITTVLDVGANVGQFGVDLRRNGYDGKIYSFEPVKKNYDSLILTTKNDSNWHALNLALGEESGIAQINVSNNAGLSSSILPMGELHKGAFPNSAYVYSEEVKISTLRDEFGKLGIDPSATLLKMDVQGYEKKVILGGFNLISKIPVCFLESSIAPLYTGEASLLELLKLLDTLGHNLLDVFRGAHDQHGRLLQVDIITSSIRNK